MSGSETDITGSGAGLATVALRWQSRTIAKATPLALTRSRELPSTQKCDSDRMSHWGLDDAVCDAPIVTRRMCAVRPGHVAHLQIGLRQRPPSV